MLVVLVFGIVSILVVSLVFFILVYSNIKKPSKASLVLNPSNDVIPNIKAEKKIREAEKKKLKKQSFIKRKGIDKKIEHWYFQAGQNKTYEDFVKTQVKFSFFGVLLAVMFYFGVALIFSKSIAILVAVLVFLIYSALPLIQIYDNINKRRGEFLRDFPYFLLTYSFVLKGGTSTITAFYEVVEKQNEGVLKEVLMKVKGKVQIDNDVLEAFKVIPQEIECLETKEFAETIRISVEKGLSIDEALGNMSSTMSKIITAKKKKNANLLQAKIMLPILFILGAVFMFFI